MLTAPRPQWARDPTNKFIADEILKGLDATPGFKGMPDIYDEASDIYAGCVASLPPLACRRAPRVAADSALLLPRSVVERFIKLLGSAGKAA